MKQFGLMCALLTAGMTVGCMSEGADIDQVQTNLVDKAIFEGEWWFNKAVINVDGDEAGIIGVYEGAEPWADPGVDKWSSGSVARIRWVIDENFLYAYRAYELISGGNDDGREADFRGQPLAAFEILDHVDIRQDYNPVTGENINVRVENTTDRRWYERQYMRIDWSSEAMATFYHPFFGKAEPASFFFEAGAHDEFPADWVPQFVTIGSDPDYRWASEWPVEEANTVHYMSFVTQSLMGPGADCLRSNIPCQTAAITVRNSFLRVPPNHNYAVETQTHAEFDRFGLFRTYQRTYVRGGADRASLQNRCDTDADCGIGGRCDAASRVCIGGLSGDYGETDFLTFYRPRFNLWESSLIDRTCRADWQCDGRFADTPGTVGSVCDPAARRCTIPAADRTTRSVAYYLSKQFPRYLVPSAFEVIGDWNETFMRGQRALTGRALPTGSPMACQSVDPTRYCFCGSPDVSDATAGTCNYRYDPFMSPTDATAAGVVDPYECYIQRPAGFTEPDHPTSYDEYPAEVYQHQFVGSECLLVLKGNSCDIDPAAACEGLGDLRYQFFNYIQHGNLYFGGVSHPRVDPATGEFITSNANMAGTSIESIGTFALEYFPVLRDEPGAAIEYADGENLRQYYSRSGNTEHPVGLLATTGGGHVGAGDTGVVGMPVDLTSYIRSVMERGADTFQRLHGDEGRALLLRDRMRRLAGTSHEQRLVESLGSNGSEALFAHTDVSRLPQGTTALDPGILEQVSPFRGGFLKSIRRDQELLSKMDRFNMDPPLAPEFHNRVYEYFANAFAGASGAEASIRMQQKYLRGVMHHEMGHSVGLRHNFGGSFDRDNYHDGYYNVVVRDGLAIPDFDSFDEVANGGDGNGFVAGDEVNNYQTELRRVRNARDAAGVGMTMTNSVMDYHGDLGIIGGIGRWDSAATIWSHFNLSEAYVGNPVMTTTNTLNGLHRADITERVYWQYYRAGAACDTELDCPQRQGRVAAGQVYQRCIQNPRRARLPVDCGGEGDCICSGFDEDLLDYASGAGYPREVWDSDMDGTPDNYPVEYLFCDDSRARDISWCSRNDAGESFREAIDFYRRRWEEGYPLSYYRRFRRRGPTNTSTGAVADAVKIYQHLFFRFFFEPGFASNAGPLGAEDQFMASLDAMNWLTELTQLPEVGSYQFDAATNSYERMGADTGMAGADFSLGLGQGFPQWSQYQDGFYGYYRRERAGVFYDKFFAMYALAERDWRLNFTIDERYFINFYDLFPVEMTEFFGGHIIGDQRWFAPRVDMSSGTPVIKHMSWYRGNCRRGGQPVPCRDSQEVVYPGPNLQDTTNGILRQWATLLALAYFPVYYDTSFEQRLSVFKRGDGSGWDIPSRQPDGTVTCAYGERLDPTHRLGCADPDYVVYTSDRFHTSYIAVKIRPRLTYNLDEEQIGYQLVERLVDWQVRARTLRAVATRTPAQDAELAELNDHLTTNESFLENLIDVQRRFGIAFYF